MFELERRKTARVSIGARVSVSRRNGSSVQAVCENLAPTGIALLMDTRLLQGERVIVTLPFLQSDLSVTCQVRYVIGLTHPHQMMRIGLCFTDLSYEQRAMIDAYVAEITGPTETGRKNSISPGNYK